MYDNVWMEYCMYFCIKSLIYGCYKAEIYLKLYNKIYINYLRFLCCECVCV